MTTSSNGGPPVDPTSTSAWAALLAHRASTAPDLRGWFAADPGRAQRLTLDAADLHVDLSKNLVTDETLSLLLQLAEETGVAGRLAGTFAGEHVNPTEDRAVLHTALRRPAGAQPPLVVDGQDVDADVQRELGKVFAFAEQVRSGWMPADYPESWPSPYRPGLLPPGTAPFTPRIKREIAKRKAKVRADLANTDNLHHPKEEVGAVLKFWNIDLG